MKFTSVLTIIIVLFSCAALCLPVHIMKRDTSPQLILNAKEQQSVHELDSTYQKLITPSPSLKDFYCSACSTCVDLCLGKCEYYNKFYNEPKFGWAVQYGVESVKHSLLENIHQLLNSTESGMVSNVACGVCQLGLNNLGLTQ